MIVGQSEQRCYDYSGRGLASRPLTGQDVGVAVLGSVDGQIGRFMRQIQTDALQLLTEAQSKQINRTPVANRPVFACSVFYLELQRELVRRIFAHVFDVSFEITELNETEDTHIITSHRNKTNAFNSRDVTISSISKYRDSKTLDIIVVA